MSSLITILITIVQAYSFLMFVWVLLSWLPDMQRTRFYRFLEKLFVPFLEPFRRIIPPINGIDISPLIGFFILHMLTSLLGQLA